MILSVTVVVAVEVTAAIEIIKVIITLLKIVIIIRNKDKSPYKRVKVNTEGNIKFYYTLAGIIFNISKL